MNKAVFLDRDGTIANVDGFCCSPEEFGLLPGVEEAIRLLNKNKFKVILITNQSGIARGYFTEETLFKIHEKLKYLLAVRDAYLDDIYYCPHLPTDDCLCHKPKTGLVLQAIKDHDIDLSMSYIVGDTGSDFALGRSLGLVSIKVGNKETRLGQLPDIAVSRLFDAANLITKKIVLIVGARGSGKSVVREVFRGCGFMFVDTENYYLKYGKLYPRENVGNNQNVMDVIYNDIYRDIISQLGDTVWEATGTNYRWGMIKDVLSRYYKVFVCKVESSSEVARQRIIDRGWESNYPSSVEKTLFIEREAENIEADFIINNSGDINNLVRQVSFVVRKINGKG